MNLLLTNDTNIVPEYYIEDVFDTVGHLLLDRAAHRLELGLYRVGGITEHIVAAGIYMSYHNRFHPVVLSRA